MIYHPYSSAINSIAGCLLYQQINYFKRQVKESSKQISSSNLRSVLCLFFLLSLSIQYHYVLLHTHSPLDHTFQKWILRIRYLGTPLGNFFQHLCIFDIICLYITLVVAKAICGWFKPLNFRKSSQSGLIYHQHTQKERSNQNPGKVMVRTLTSLRNPLNSGYNAVYIVSLILNY